MAIYISRDFILSDSIYDINENNPRIGYQNLLESGSASVSADEEPDHPVSNILNVSTAEYYLAPVFNNYSSIKLTVPPATVDYVGIAGHNLSGVPVILSYRYSESDNWTVLMGRIPGDNSAIMFLFNPMESVPYWNIEFNGGDTRRRFGTVYLGKSIALERRVYVGHSPMNYARATNVTSGMSETGQYLGRVVRSQALDVSLSQQNVHPEYYRSVIDPFAKAAITKPFFMAWRPKDYPNEIGYCWLTKDIVPQNQLSNGMMQFDIVGNALSPLAVEL